MKRFIMSIILLLIATSVGIAAPAEVELGAVGTLKTFFSPSTDLYEATLTAQSKTKEESSSDVLGVTLVFQRTYQKGSDEKPVLMVQVRTRGGFYGTANPIRVEIVTGGSAQNVTLYPTAILGSEANGTYYSTIDYPIAETHKIADALRAGTIKAMHLSYQLPNKSRQNQTLIFSDNLKMELKKLGTLDLTQPDTFEAIMPI